MIIRRRHTLGLFGASILALSALLLSAPASTGQAAGLVAHQLATNPTSTSTTKPAAITTPTTAVTATPSPTSASTPVGQDDHPELSSASTCANPSKQSNSNAFIDYCSPSFANDVEGPWGAHITFTVNTAGKQAREIYLFAVSPAANNECATIGSADLTFKNGSLPDLGQLVSASGRAPVNLSFTWTFPTNDFSTTSDYCLALQLSGGNTVSSSTGFSLLTRDPPCVVLTASGDTPDCSTAQPQPLQVVQGQTVTISGKNWLPGDQKQAIHVSLQCVPETKCSKDHLDETAWSIKGSGSDDIGGMWKLENVTVPRDVTGQYYVEATMSDGAITFGDATPDKGSTFTLDILLHPCVGVSSGGTCAWSGATNDASQSAAQGKYLAVSGNNWRPTSKVSVYLLSGSLDESDCSTHRPKSSAGVSQFSALSSSVSGQVPLPTKAKVGDKYTICASGPSPASGTSDQVYAAVHINITKGATHQPFSLLSLLGGLFALISLGVFVLTMPRRAAVPQPVGRRQ